MAAGDALVENVRVLTICHSAFMIAIVPHAMPPWASHQAFRMIPTEKVLHGGKKICNKLEDYRMITEQNC